MTLKKIGPAFPGQRKARPYRLQFYSLAKPKSRLFSQPAKKNGKPDQTPDLRRYSASSSRADQTNEALVDFLQKTSKRTLSPKSAKKHFNNIRGVAEHLAMNSRAVPWNELLAKFNWLRTKFQIFHYRQTGILYRFHLPKYRPSSKLEHIEFAYVVADQCNKVLAWLYSFGNEGND